MEADERSNTRVDIRRIKSMPPETRKLHENRKIRDITTVQQVLITGDGQGKEMELLVTFIITTSASRTRSSSRTVSPFPSPRRILR